MYGNISAIEHDRVKRILLRTWMLFLCLMNLEFNDKDLYFILQFL